jgi:hypothetical protein
MAFDAFICFYQNKGVGKFSSCANFSATYNVAQN